VAVSLWRVQVLPLGPFSYRTRELDFTREYLEGIVAAFDGGAYDFVPFHLADSSGAGTSDPARYRGDVTALEVVSDGLDALIAATPEGDEAITTVPGPAAAPRLVENYRSSDGPAFPVAVQHVLGTTHPMITRLRPWKREA
jgi:hypothetical protein